MIVQMVSEWRSIFAMWLTILQPVLTVQRELRPEQIPIGTTVIVFAQSLSVSL